MIRRLLAAIATCCSCSAMAAEAGPGPQVWDQVLTAIDGRPYPLDQHRGQVLLIVNTASRCGFTKQYADLQLLHGSHGPRGLVVIGVPSNDFGVLGGQEPGDETEIQAFCSRTFGVTFPLMAKHTVKGSGMHPLFRILTTSGPQPAEVSWNFNKFLIGRDGRVRLHAGSRTTPRDEGLVAAIDAALAEAAPDIGSK